MAALRRPIGVALAVLALASAACNAERKQECDALLAVMPPLDQGTPASAAVDAVHKQVAAMTFQDQPLGIYAKNYGERLTILSNTLKLQEGADAPDGTVDEIKRDLKAARTDREDVARYCAE